MCSAHLLSDIFQDRDLSVTNIGGGGKSHKDAGSGQQPRWLRATSGTIPCRVTDRKRVDGTTGVICSNFLYLLKNKQKPSSLTWTFVLVFVTFPLFKRTTPRALIRGTCTNPSLMPIKCCFTCKWSLGFFSLGFKCCGGFFFKKSS